MDERKGNVLTHRGTRYGGAAQSGPTPTVAYTSEEYSESWEPPVNTKPRNPIKQSGVRSPAVPGARSVIDGKNVAQSPSKVLKSVPRPKLNTKFLKQKGIKPEVPRKIFEASDVLIIEWETFQKPRYFSLNCRYACHLVRSKRLAIDLSSSPTLYEGFVSRLEPLYKRRRVEGPTLLCQVASGKVSEEGFGYFIKFTVLGEEFILPQSFYSDCRAAIPERVRRRF